VPDPAMAGASVMVVSLPNRGDKLDPLGLTEK
jgi:hypothetical protein